jgi:GNAT superfamily N-acetyltransferase
MQVADLAHRIALLDDMKDLWALVRRTAADIPCSLESESDQEYALTEIMKCCTAEFSPVVVDAKRNVVGAMLARRDELDWGLRNVETINVALAAVSADHREQGVFKMLIEAILKRNAPVYIEVKAGEAQGLATELKGSGFSLAKAEEGSELYKWEPAAQVKAA